MPSLFIYSIGPVQDLIAAAKRCRDLWFGSWLLSELSKAVALAVAASVSREALIFPHVASAADLEPESALSVANKIVAELPDGIDPATVGARCREHLTRRLHELRDRAFADIRRPAARHLQRPLADQQLDDLIEAQWVSVAFDANGYVAARRAAETLLASAKPTRLWAPVGLGSSAPKSSLDGLRESVLDERIYRDDALARTRVRHHLALDEGERLCGVGMLKRHGRRADAHNHHRFFSTPHLAALPLLERMRTDPERLLPLWSRYFQALVDEDAWRDETVPARCSHPVLGKHDGQLLFPSRVRERLDHLTPAQQTAALGRILPHLHTLLRALDQPAEGPLPYIAILVADGDHMGAAIERQHSAEEHRRLSAALDGFSRGARAIVESDDLHGELIYAGGDDVMAFVPVHRVLTCARRLKESFVGALAPFGATDAPAPTLSVGVGICHFIEPMTRSLAVARDAERLAKRERDSLAIVVDKRSGAPTSITGKWGLLDARLERLVRWHLDDEVPDGLAHHLAALHALDIDAAQPGAATLAAITGFEVAQLLRQKHRKRGQERLEETVHDELSDAARDPQLAAQLIVAQLLARAEQTAHPGALP